MAHGSGYQLGSIHRVLGHGDLSDFKLSSLQTSKQGYRLAVKGDHTQGAHTIAAEIITNIVIPYSLYKYSIGYLK